MDWLDDTRRRKNESEEATARQDREMRERQYVEDDRRRELVKVWTPLVMRLLDDVGRLEWGCGLLCRKYIVEQSTGYSRDPATGRKLLGSSYSWLVRERTGESHGRASSVYTYAAFVVVLRFRRSEDGPPAGVDWFVVEGKHSHHASLSEEDLKAALRKALEQGRGGVTIGRSGRL